MKVQYAAKRIENYLDYHNYFIEVLGHTFVGLHNLLNPFFHLRASTVLFEKSSSFSLKVLDRWKTIMGMLS